MVNYTLDSFLNSNLYICGETEIRIHQNLISFETDLSEIHTIYSHPQSLAQCRNWLDTHCPHANRVTVNSNAQAVKRAQNEPNCAAIAGKNAAEYYKVPMLNSRIEDEPNNTTRFLIIGQKPIPQSGEDKTSILVSANDRPGLLLQLIEPLEKHGITMTKLESRPAKKGLWGYVFFIDMLGHYDDPKVKAALADIEKKCSLFRILGSYPIARF
jgi:chorismate mutase/prephenate dehydratase